jgi:hypothetical protein
MLSMLEESDPVVLTNLSKSCNDGINGVVNRDCLARTQFRFPSMVLISPLWAKNLNGELGASAVLYW